VEAHDIAKNVNALVEPMLGNGICEVHVDPRLKEAADATGGPAVDMKI